MKILSKAPLRIGLSGGGTDINEFSYKFGGDVINITIDKFCYTFLDTKTNSIIFESIDQEVKSTYSKLNSKNHNKLILHKFSYDFMIKKFNFGNKINLKLSTFTENPPGSGLGGSSCLVISIIKAFDRLMNLKLSKYQLANIGYTIERDLAKIPGGYQDFYASAFGGCNRFFFGPKNRFKSVKINLSTDIFWKLDTLSFLYFSNISRYSGKIINNQISKISKKKEYFIKLRDNTNKLHNSIIENDYTKMISIINLNWKYKKKTSQLISSNKSEEFVHKIFKLGASAVKISGAGGGGHYFIVAKDLNCLHEIKSFLSNKNGRIIDFNFYNHPVQSYQQ